MLIGALSYKGSEGIRSQLLVFLSRKEGRENGSNDKKHLGKQKPYLILFILFKSLLG